MKHDNKNEKKKYNDNLVADSFLHSAISLDQVIILKLDAVKQMVLQSSSPSFLQKTDAESVGRQLDEISMLLLRESQMLRKARHRLGVDALQLTEKEFAIESPIGQ